MVETIEIEIDNIKAVQCGNIQLCAGDGIHVQVPRLYYRNGKKIYCELGRPMNKKELQERMKLILNELAEKDEASYITGDDIDLQGVL